MLVFQEDDARFWVGLGSSRDDRFLVIASGSKLTTEVRLLDAARPAGAAARGGAPRARASSTTSSPPATGC